MKLGYQKKRLQIFNKNLKFTLLFILIVPYILYVYVYISRTTLFMNSKIYNLQGVDFMNKRIKELESQVVRKVIPGYARFINGLGEISKVGVK